MKIVRMYYKPTALARDAVDGAFLNALEHLEREAEQKHDKIIPKICRDVRKLAQEHPENLALKLNKFLQNSTAMITGEYWKDSLGDVLIAHKDNLLLLQLAPPMLNEVQEVLEKLLPQLQGKPGFEDAATHCKTILRALSSETMALEEKLRCFRLVLGELQEIDFGSYQSTGAIDDAHDEIADDASGFGMYVLSLLLQCFKPLLECIKSTLLKKQGYPKEREHYSFHQVPREDNIATTQHEFQKALEVLKRVTNKLDSNDEFGVPDKVTL